MAILKFWWVSESARSGVLIKNTGAMRYYLFAKKLKDESDQASRFAVTSYNVMFFNSWLHIKKSYGISF